MKVVKLPKCLIHLLKFCGAKVVLNFHLNVVSYWGSNEEGEFRLVQGKSLLTVSVA